MLFQVRSEGHKAMPSSGTRWLMCTECRV